ncbi:hypothetical protein [Actinoplanes xinjiangensis]|uniref:hypothetical protein n=1 Tax=Actinoplanes xinjiangensis TaxID=512350 RepID=UPI00343B5E39
MTGDRHVTPYRTAPHHLGPSFTTELDSAFRAARRLGLWLNTSAAAGVEEYLAQGVRIYRGVSRRGPVGGDGRHNHISTRAALRTYDRPLHTLVERLHRSGTRPG